MEARFFQIALATLSLASLGAGYRTENFIVSAPTASLAKEIGQAAEHYRRGLAKEWVGYELSRWQQPCPIRAYLAEGAGGETSFVFDNGRAHSWRMTIQGSRERLLDSVLPHEITHTIFATHFGRPLPRWVDEGACTTVEHESEKRKQQTNLLHFLTAQRGIAFNRMFAMSEYPADILPLYAQGYSVSRFLIALGGRKRLVRYIGDGMKQNDWTTATKKHYGFENLSELQLTWLDWVRHGSRPIASQTLISDARTLSAATPRSKESTASSGRSTPATRKIFRGQNSDHSPATRNALVPVPPAASYATTVARTDSWYARGQKRTSVPPENSARNNFLPVDTSRSNSPARLVEHSTTRPQPVEKSKQIILEWSRTGPWSPGTTTRLATEYVPKARYNMSPDVTGTRRR